MPRRMIAGKLSAALMCLIWLFISSLAAPTPLPRAQEAQPKAQLQRTARIYVSALDKHGQPILDLKAGDIQIFEGKKEDQIVSVAPASSQPLRAGILVDISGSERANENVADPDALSAYIRSKLTPKDFVFVATFGDSITLVTDWTNSPEQAGYSVRQALAGQPRGGSTIYEAIYWVCQNRMNGRTGNKILLVISDFEDNLSRHTPREAVSAAFRANASVFAVLQVPVVPRGVRVAHRGQRAAKDFADKTGGLVVKVQSAEDFRRGLDEIAQALAGRYIVEFTPYSVPLPFHRIKVQCTRRGVRLLAPNTYFLRSK